MRIAPLALKYRLGENYYGDIEQIDMEAAELSAITHSPVSYTHLDVYKRQEFDYPTFHLSMDCFWAEVTKGHLELKEAEAAKWLTKDQLDSVAWLPADVTLIDKIRRYMK